MMSDFVGYIDENGVEFEGGFTPEGAVGPIGPQGPQGEKGDKGDQGIQGIQGIQGEQGPAGQDGYTPVKGTDYFTASDIADFEADVIADLSPTMGSSVDLDINSSTYVMTLSLKNPAGTTISSDSVDLPLESMVVSGSYDSVNKKVVLTLQSGSTVEFSVADLISGLQTEITSQNKLSADLVDDTSTTNKFVTASDKTTWNGKQDALTAGTNITIASGTISATDTTYSAFTGTDGTTAGAAGLVPAPATTDAGKYLKSDGTWAEVAAIKEITTDVNAWDLADGYYRVKNGVTITLKQSKYIYANENTNLLNVCHSNQYSSQYLFIESDGITKATCNTLNNTSTISYTPLSVFDGTDGVNAGTSGLVPAPTTSDDGKFLCADGTWQASGGATINYGTTDLTPGVSPLADGTFYFCYE